ncbi:MAG: preprotein translocase subunit SecG [Pirellulales bacterium]|nr:preprotein translocase subunit SecG [Pirellulales bacterium]
MILSHPIHYDGVRVVTPFLIAAFGQTLFKLLLGGAATFLILLVLVQRGRGGGLAGALGGMGGSSAFGAKAGDVFTKITIGAATFWILICIAGTTLSSTGDRLIVVQVKGPATSCIQVPVADDAEGAAEEATPDAGGDPS